MQKLANVVIPEGMEFSDLRLTRESDGSVGFDWSVIERICQASNIPPSIFRDAPEDNVARLIMDWYLAHRQDEGDPDPIAEELIREVMAEEEAGQTASHRPGRA